ncbi:MAG: hypothetical protein J3Q66DRAFT_374969 [Benniella sp.]|nr:MAG: hypothetical protein J3Q66DRAFT_374969 [Benniella sp.]
MSRESFTVRDVFRTLAKTAVLLLGASILPVQAQTYQPICSSETAYTTLEGRAMYMMGGVYSPHYFGSSSFMIDLSQSWSVDSPKFGHYSGGFGNKYFPGGITADGKRWTTLNNKYGYVYDFKNNTWTEQFRFRIEGTYGLTGATDSKTDTMYIPFGYPNADKSNGMLKINLKTGDAVNDPRKHPAVALETGYATAWNPVRNSVIYVGKSGVYEYTWEKGWTPFFSKGLDVIPPRGACLVSVSNGTKMALFGGTIKDGKANTGDIYVLDLTKKSWTKASVDSKQKSRIARQTAACGSTGDQVIVWGGNTVPGFGGNGFECPKDRTLVFNVKTMKWTDKYVAPGKK